MYESLSSFLKTFSAGNPLLWTTLVVVVITATGVGLYLFWEAVLKAASAIFSRGTRR